MSALRLHARVLAAAAGVILLAARPVHASGSPDGDAEYRPGLPPGLFGSLLMAEFAVRRGDEAHVDRAVRSYLDNARSHTSPALAARATRMAERAARYGPGADAARLWRELDPDSRDARRAHALMLVRAGRTEEATDALRAIAAQPDETGRTGLDVVLDVLRKEPDADRRVRIMEAVADTGLESRYALARVLAEARQVERALKLLEVLRRESPDEDRFAIAHALLLHGHGDRGAALAVLAGHRGGVEQGDAVLRTHAQLLAATGRVEEAADGYATLLLRDPNDHDARWELARLLIRVGRYEDAREHFRKLYPVPHWRDGAWYFTGLVEESLADPDRAIRAYRRVRDGIYYLSARIRSAAIMAETGPLKWARWHLAATPRYSQSDDIRLYRAESELLARADRSHEAIAVLDTAIQVYPEDNDLLYARAMVAERLDRLDILEQDLRAIIDRDPDHAEALNALGYTLADRTDRYEEAYELVERALALEPDRSHIVDSMGWVLYRLGRHAEAAEHLRRSYELEPDPVVAAHLGEVLWALGNRDEARAIWDTALEEAPDNEVLLETIERLGSERLGS